MKRNIDFKFHTIHMVDNGITVGYTLNPTPNGELDVRIASSWTNPKDQFVKARGREIVAGRLQANREDNGHVRTITVPRAAPTTAAEYRELEGYVIDIVLENPPKAVIDYAQRQQRKVLRMFGAI